MTAINNSDRFQIVFSKLGVKAIYDPVSIDALELLNNSDKSLTELSKEIGADSSALYFQMDKLIDEGAIKKIKDDSYGKNTKYRNTSSTLIKSVDSESSFYPEMDITLESLIPESAEFDKKAVENAVIHYMFNTGLDFSPILEGYGQVLALIYSDEITGIRPEEIMYSMKSFMRKHNLCNMEVYSYNPLSIVIKIDAEEPKDIALHVSPCIGLIKESMKRLGLDYKVKNREIFGLSKNMVRVDFTSTKLIENYNISQPIEEDDNDIFALVSMKDGTLKVVDPDIQSRILFELEKRPMCAIDLINNTGMPRSTIISNLGKLKDMGIIEALSSNSAGYYALNCKILVKKDKRSSLSLDDIKKMRDLIIEDGDNLRENSLVYVMYALNRLGFNPEDMTFNLGASMADEILKHGDVNVLDSVNRLYRKLPDVEIRVEKIVPFTFSIIAENGEYDRIKTKVKFYSGLISKLITGDEYNRCRKDQHIENVDGKHIFTMTLSSPCLD